MAILNNICQSYPTVLTFSTTLLFPFLHTGLSKDASHKVLLSHFMFLCCLGWFLSTLGESLRVFYLCLWSLLSLAGFGLQLLVSSKFLRNFCIKINVFIKLPTSSSASLDSVSTSWHWVSLNWQWSSAYPFITQWFQLKQKDLKLKVHKILSTKKFFRTSTSQSSVTTKRVTICFEYKNTFSCWTSNPIALDFVSWWILEVCKFRKLHPATARKEKRLINLLRKLGEITKNVFH